MIKKEDDDFAFEPVPGLPEHLPDGEEILWQGRPDWWSLTKSALLFWWVVGWFALLVVWRFLVVSAEFTTTQAVWAAIPLVLMGAVVAALLMLTAYAQAKASLYTITNRRVVMRVGAALTVTFNIPFVQIANANLNRRRDGTGTIAFELMGKNRISYLVAWPHVRPWHFRTQPALRSIPDAEHVAALVAEYAAARVAEPKIAVRSGTPSDAVAAE